MVTAGLIGHMSISLQEITLTNNNGFDSNPEVTQWLWHCFPVLPCLAFILPDFCLLPHAGNKKMIGTLLYEKRKRKLNYDLDFCLGKTLLEGQGKGHSYGASLESQAFSQKAGEACPHATGRCWQLLSINLQLCFWLRWTDHRTVEARDLSSCFWRYLIQPSTKLDQLEQLAQDCPGSAWISPGLDSSQPLMTTCCLVHPLAQQTSYYYV